MRREGKEKWGQDQVWEGTSERSRDPGNVLCMLTKEKGNHKFQLAISSASYNRDLPARNTGKSGAIVVGSEQQLLICFKAHSMRKN